MGVHVHLNICENGGKALIDGEVRGMTEKASLEDTGLSQNSARNEAWVRVCHLGLSFSGKGILSTFQSVSQACAVCHQVNIGWGRGWGGGAVRSPTLLQSVQRWWNQLGEDWQINFTHMPTCKGYKYLLVMEETFTGWIEAFPAKTEHQKSV